MTTVNGGPPLLVASSQVLHTYRPTASIDNVVFWTGAVAPVSARRRRTIPTRESAHTHPESRGRRAQPPRFGRISLGHAAVSRHRARVPGLSARDLEPPGLPGLELREAGIRKGPSRAAQCGGDARCARRLGPVILSDSPAPSGRRCAAPAGWCGVSAVHRSTLAPACLPQLAPACLASGGPAARSRQRSGCSRLASTREGHGKDVLRRDEHSPGAKDPACRGHPGSPSTRSRTSESVAGVAAL